MLHQGRLADWWRNSVGEDSAALPPSVRCGFEAALLSALAAAADMSLALAILPQMSSTSSPGVTVSGLVDGCGSAAETAAAAVELIRRGYSTLKLKVCSLQYTSCRMF